MPRSDAVGQARAQFPRGLFQPPGTFRFSADALLLAAFALRHCMAGKKGAFLLDLGCGCGVVGLACLLADFSLAAAGVDVVPEVVAAADGNARRLGLEERYAARVADLAAGGKPVRPPGSCDVVVANMPYRAPGSGRLPRPAARARALFADPHTIPAFLGAAKDALAAQGSLALVYPWQGRRDLLRALEGHGFIPTLLLPVETGREVSARVLVRAAHAASGEARADAPGPPLVLHAGKGGAYTPEALAFCPWLASRPWEEAL